MRRLLFFVILAAVQLFAAAPSAYAGFGIAPDSLSVRAENKDGTVDAQAGSHPYAFNLGFAVNQTAGGLSEGGAMRDVVVDLPSGMFANPEAIPRCAREAFEGSKPLCAPSTQVGVVRAFLPGTGEAVGPIYNLAPPPGVAVQFGFSVAELTALFNGSVRGEAGFAVRDAALNIPAEATAVSATIWGTPADPAHDSERGQQASEGDSGEVSSEAPLLPYLFLPGSCLRPEQITVSVDSKLNPGVFTSETAALSTGLGAPRALTGCEAVPFEPAVLAAPTVSSAETSSGLAFRLQLPNGGLLNPKEAAVVETEPERMEVALPEGLTGNPAVASGLEACSESQIGFKKMRGEEPVFDEGVPDCPETSKLGSIVAHTPLLEEPLEGAVYLATPRDNPFNSLLALYVVARAPERGVLIKLAADASLNPVTGQITTTIDGMPPLPYSSVDLRLREGPRAPLTTPVACGVYRTTARLYPFSAPKAATVRTASFTVSSGPEGGGCVGSESGLPNSPSFEAGTQTSLAGAYSPFVLNLARGDGSQRFASIDTTLPEGLLGRLAGVPFCSDAQVAQAVSRAGEGEGALEQASQSCPANSEIGTVTIGAGAGSSPTYVQGKAYLAGPYRNAPLSLAIVTPAIAGPFDLGTVVVRVALYIDPNTAQVSAVSDPIPTILDGIPLDVRSISLDMSRTGFTFNPTSCEPLSVTGQETSTVGQSAGLSSHFQVGGCQGLPFKPSLTASTQGKTSKASGASLTVKVAQKSGEADIHKVDLTLPTVLPARLSTLQQACTEAQFAANPAGCPPGSFIGTAKAITPVLSVPLTGPAILVSHGGAAFPDVVFLLQANERGANINVDLDGKTDIKKGITYSRFETVPDAPISSFETNLPEGPHSVLAATGNLCASKLAIPTELTGQNGVQVKQNTSLAVTGCPKTKVLTRAQKLALALKACHKKPKGKKRTTCERTARKKYGPLKKAKRKTIKKK